MELVLPIDARLIPPQHSELANGTVLEGFESIDLAGSDGRDVVTGGAASDILSGYFGNDRLYGRGGNDLMEGGDGSDRMYGGGGEDSLSDMWDGGSDVLDGGDDNDTIALTTGSDRAYGGAGSDTLTVGGDGRAGDVVDGGAGFDKVIFWDFGTVHLDLGDQANNGGSVQNDSYARVESFEGTSSSDVMLGNRFANVFVGGAGDDILDGRGGNDRLIGNDGSDTMTGGLGADRFVLAAKTIDYATDWPADAIADFSRAQGDRLEVSRAAFGLEDGEEVVVVAGSDPGASGMGAQFLFDTDDRSLWFDADGAGAAEEAILVATLEGVATLDVSDFVVVV